MTTTNTIIQKGKRFKTGNLIEQAAYIYERAGADLPALQQAGCSADLLENLNNVRLALIALEGKQESAKGNIPLATDEVKDALIKAKKWIKIAQYKAKRAFEYDTHILAEFRMKVSTGKSVPNTIAVMSRFIELHQKHGAVLETVGGGMVFANAGREILEELQRIDGQKEVTRKNLPALSEEVYAKQAELHSLLKHIVYIAKEVFIDDPLKAAAYSLEILERGGPKRKADEAPAAGSEDAQA